MMIYLVDDLDVSLDNLDYLSVDDLYGLSVDYLNDLDGISLDDLDNLHDLSVDDILYLVEVCKLLTSYKNRPWRGMHYAIRATMS